MDVVTMKEVSFTHMKVYMRHAVKFISTLQTKKCGIYWTHFENCRKFRRILVWHLVPLLQKEKTFHAKKKSKSKSKIRTVVIQICVTVQAGFNSLRIALLTMSNSNIFKKVSSFCLHPDWNSNTFFNCRRGVLSMWMS